MGGGTNDFFVAQNSTRGVQSVHVKIFDFRTFWWASEMDLGKQIRTLSVLSGEIFSSYEAMFGSLIAIMERETRPGQTARAAIVAASSSFTDSSAHEFYSPLNLKKA